MKCAPKAMPGCSFTIEDEVKGSAVEGKLTLKYLEPTTGISFDKLTVKGSTYGVEASKTVSGVKFKGKLNPHDLSSTAVPMKRCTVPSPFDCGLVHRKLVPWVLRRAYIVGNSRILYIVCAVRLPCQKRYRCRIKLLSSN